MNSADFVLFVASQGAQLLLEADLNKQVSILFVNLLNW